MNQTEDKPKLISREENELILSGTGLAEFVRAILGRELPVRFSSKGFSMFPFIKDGDRVKIYPKNSSLKRGDIVAFLHPTCNHLVIHRITKKVLGGYILRGDYTHEPDGLIPEKNILGIVKEVEKNGKTKRIGLGPEKLLIAVLSENNILIHFCRFFVLVQKLFIRKF